MEVEAKAGVAPTPETNEQFIARRDAEIKTWLDRKAALDSIKPQEMEARNTVAATLFPNPKKGTQRYQLNGGYSIKLVYGTSYSLGDKTKVIETPDGQVPVSINDQVYDNLRRVAAFLIESGRTVEEADAFCNSMVKWSPELSEKAYLALDPTNNVDAHVKAILDEMITTKPKSPTLEFELPKEQK